VEDDSVVSSLVMYNLRRAGYEVIREGNGRTGLEAALHLRVDLVLMDLLLPGLDGLAAVKEIVRRKPYLPVIIVTALDRREDILRGFECGASDYVTKPFDMDLLLARITAGLRRASQAGPQPSLENGFTFAAGDITLDRDAHILRTPAGEVRLNRKEHGLLELLLSQPGRLFHRSEILESVWHQSQATSSRSLDVHVRRVRAKLEAVDAGVTLETVRGVGHRITSST
jgi:DNA-binding response OmpR family regulator